MPAREFHVLLVEDNPADARLTAETFKEARSGTRLSHVTSGTEALEFLRRSGTHAAAGRPDLILLDLNMPGMDGRQVLAAVKSDDALRHLPIVVLTTSHAEIDVTQAYDLKANCYVKKPTQLEAFQRVIRGIDHFWFSTALVPAE